MSTVKRVRARNIGFSRAPHTLKRNLVTNTSIFEGSEKRGASWSGQIVEAHGA